MTVQEVLDKHNVSWGWGGCADGWAALIDKLITDLKATGWSTEGEAAQIKEKFGGLRFYVNRATKEQYQLIMEAERKSRFICELCGKEGKLMKSETYWYRTVCPECAEKHEYTDIG